MKFWVENIGVHSIQKKLLNVYVKLFFQLQVETLGAKLAFQNFIFVKTTRNRMI